ncbi:cellulose biosynthesis cyclic di-GMP-binding regulatory protein BcsB [Klebsiella variicola subsp. variicola]|nr:cellulose biosynthesis cyclic di-GMP-binding regulatory protein BcsB [Klebsiella variicola subsp. variicola]
MRSDELVANALLNLEYTPSPSLLPVQSQLKVYLNDELMGVLPVTKEQLGKKIRAQLPIDPLYITDFNRVRLEFVGHYRDVCENPRQQHAVAGRRARKLSGSHLPVAEGA